MPALLSLRDGRLGATNLGEKKANVKRNAQINAQSRTNPDRFNVALHTNTSHELSLARSFTSSLLD
jgi:hypothetical protein